jgi:RNA polymerase sigma-70 factor (ECF subfamily)
MEKNKLEFSDVYNEFREGIRRYLERMVGKGDAEDLTQEVFIKVDKGLNDFKGDSKLSTWVYRIATNTALDKLRSRSFREDKKKVRLDPAVETEGDEANKMLAAQTNLTAQREVIRKEMTECIREFVDRLSEDYRTVIILSELKDLKNQEIAEILGISLDAVKIRLHRARARLKAEFEAGCDFYHDEDGLACDRKKTEKKCE